MTDALRSWQNFYLLTGGAAATLMGLVFVAASLSANLSKSDVLAGDVRTFVTPIILHFSTVLLVAIFFTIPTQTYFSMGILLTCCGAAGFSYESSTAVQLWRRHRRTYPVDRSDWFWRVGLPAAGYLLVLYVAIRLVTNAIPAFSLLAIAISLFLLLGVRNAWNLVLWITRKQLSSR